jgi:hypothetical protein
MTDTYYFINVRAYNSEGDERDFVIGYVTNFILNPQEYDNVSDFINDFNSLNDDVKIDTTIGAIDLNSIDSKYLRDAIQINDTISVLQDNFLIRIYKVVKP